MNPESILSNFRGSCHNMISLSLYMVKPGGCKVLLVTIRPNYAILLYRDMKKPYFRGLRVTILRNRTFYTYRDNRGGHDGRQADTHRNEGLNQSD